MAVRVEIQPLNYRHKWITTGNVNDIIRDSIFESFNSYNPTYEDYVGIYHQIMAIESGYTD